MIVGGIELYSKRLHSYTCY